MAEWPVVITNFRSSVKAQGTKLVITNLTSKFQNSGSYPFLYTTPPSSNCPLFQDSLTINKLYKQMYVLINLLIKLSMLQST